jgi:hypothetical protein
MRRSALQPKQLEYVRDKIIRDDYEHERKYDCLDRCLSDTFGSAAGAKAGEAGYQCNFSTEEKGLSYTGD